MGAVEFASRLIGQVISWPVAAVVIALVFRTQIADLIGRIRSYEGLGQKLTFGDQLAKIERVAETAVEALEPSPADHEATDDDELLDAGASPALGIIRSWENLSAAVDNLAEAVLGSERPRRPPGRVLDEVQRSGVVNPGFVEAVNELRTLRNLVAHGRHNPTAGEAVAYAETARELTRAASVIAQLTRTRR